MDSGPANFFFFFKGWGGEEVGVGGGVADELKVGSGGKAGLITGRESREAPSFGGVDGFAWRSRDVE